LSWRVREAGTVSHRPKESAKKITPGKITGR
jgi:hypothetical protein